MVVCSLFPLRSYLFFGGEREGDGWREMDGGRGREIEGGRWTEGGRWREGVGEMEGDLFLRSRALIWYIVLLCSPIHKEVTVILSLLSPEKVGRTKS